MSPLKSIVDTKGQPLLHAGMPWADRIKKAPSIEITRGTMDDPSWHYVVAHANDKQIVIHLHRAVRRPIPQDNSVVTILGSCGCVW